MQQLLLDLLPPVIPTLDNFVVGNNALLVSTVCHLGTMPDTGTSSLYLWGDKGSGRTHLLRAWANARGLPYIDGVSHQSLDTLPMEVFSGFALDNAECLNRDGQRKLFALYNRLHSSFSPLLVSGAVPVALLGWSGEIASRLAWGFCFEIQTLSDLHKREALQAYAQQRGIILPTALLDYLFTHVRRDLPCLMEILIELDQRSLMEKRPINLSLLRDILHEMLDRPSILSSPLTFRSNEKIGEIIG